MIRRLSTPWNEHSRHGRSFRGRHQPAVTFRVNAAAEVATQVARFSAPESYYWRRALREIADNPFCRRGTITERAVASVPYPLVRRSYAITCHEYVSGEVVYLFVAEFLPGRTAVYVVDEESGEIEIFFLRK
jgi:hypothetical protein